MSKSFDLVIKNARVVRPNKTAVDCLDIGIKDGKVARLAPDIQAERREGSLRRQEPAGVSRAASTRICTSAFMRRSRRTRSRKARPQPWAA